MFNKDNYQISHSHWSKVRAQDGALAEPAAGSAGYQVARVYSSTVPGRFVSTTLLVMSGAEVDLSVAAEYQIQAQGVVLAPHVA